MNVKGLLQILIDLIEESLFDQLMRDWGDFFSIVWMVRSVLHEAIHDMIAFRAEGFIVNRRYC